MSSQLPSAIKAKDQARHLRAKMTKEGQPIGHAKSLELVAHQHRFRDWNTMIAIIGDRRSSEWEPGDAVKGTYLGKPFTAQVISVAMLRPGWFQLQLQLDEAVDVVASDGFTNLRRRIRGIIGPKGHSMERTSDGQPHLQMNPTL